jgi:wyosine [tRNA(Phe)-imidazoG37] synthetase (radical SAM superfamily)
LSLGINLDPQKTCNFDCVYCEVIDRRELTRRTGRPPIAPAEILEEVRDELGRWPLPGSGQETLADLAYAGDGEPSTFPGFLELSRKILDARDAAGFASVPLVLITNGSGLDRTEMVAAHDLFSERNGVFWVKLDAGTGDYYRKVCRSAIGFDRILGNLTSTAKRHPVVVQSMFFRFHGETAGKEEIDAWVNRLADVLAAGGAIRLVQVYTVVRETMEPGVLPFLQTELDDIVAKVKDKFAGVPVETFG